MAKRVNANGPSPAGMVSARIHSAIEVGDTLRVGPPAGDFRLSGDEHPVVMISVGVGFTPMISMLQHIERTRPRHAVTFAFAVHRQSTPPASSRDRGGSAVLAARSQPCVA